MATIAYFGNFQPEHSTENDVRRTLVDMGQRVVTVQEQEPLSWRHLIDNIDEFDLVLWTSTYQYAQDVGVETQRELQFRAREAGVMTVGFHLDRWWGLERWKRVLTDPFFRCDLVFTADGGHQREYEMAGVAHVWSPPAIAPHNAVKGIWRQDYACDVAFVGSWQGGYHPEWRHRHELVRHLQHRWGDQLRLFPEVNQSAIRGQDLADLYASAKVVVGDSCLVPKSDGSPMTHYCSDRVFETIGRNGMLIHPRVHGITGMAVNTLDDALLENGHHLLTWELWDWGQLDRQIDWALDDSGGAAFIAEDGYRHVAASHTYRNRLERVLELAL